MATVLNSSRPDEGLLVSAARSPSGVLRLWRAHPKKAAGAGLFALIAAAAIISAQHFASVPQARVHALPPAPPAMTVRPIAPDQAVKVNADIPAKPQAQPRCSVFQLQGQCGNPLAGPKLSRQRGLL